MKKLLLQSLLTITIATTLYSSAGNTPNNPIYVITNQAQNSHVSSPGPLSLGFKKAPINSLAPGYEGAIIETILKHDNLKNDLGSALATTIGLKQNQHNIDSMITSLQDGSLTYEQIVQLIKEKRDTARFKILCVLEEGLIKLYQEYAYLYTLPTDGYTGFIGRAFFTGIRTPLCWKEDTNQMKQIISELDALANIADAHYVTKSIKMKSRIALLRNWRKTTIITTTSSTLAAIIGYIACKKQIQKNTFNN